MKNYFPILPIVLLSALFSTGCSDGDDQKSKIVENLIQDSINIRINELLRKSLVANPIPEEDPLYLEVSAVDGRKAKGQIESTRFHMSLNSNTLALRVADIDTAAIKNFREIARALPNAVTPCTNSLTAMEIFYAVKNRTLTLYYKAVKFCRVSTTQGQGAQLFGNYKLRESDVFYKYNGGSTLTPLNAAEAAIAQDEIDAYADAADGIKVRQSTTDDVLGDFKSLANIHGNVQALIFSFQEIIMAARDNKNSGKVRLWNAMEELDAGSKVLMKHILLVSSDNIQTAVNTVTVPVFSGKFANLSHLCPPSCNGDDFTFRLSY